MVGNDVHERDECFRYEWSITVFWSIALFAGRNRPRSSAFATRNRGCNKNSAGGSSRARWRPRNGMGKHLHERVSLSGYQVLRDDKGWQLHDRS